MNESVLHRETLLRQTKYLNNIVEQDHRFIKRLTNPMLGFKSFRTAEQTLKGIEAVHMLRKGQAIWKNTSGLSVMDWFQNLFVKVA
jgi:IS6 family transposase